MAARLYIMHYMTHELAWRPLAELAKLLREGEASSREIVDDCLGRIASLDGKLHAFVEVYGDDARKLAQAADLARSARAVRGPLHGLPIAFKDLLEMEGRQTTAGAQSWRGRISDHTATSVTRLLDAGMIPLGKTHLVEFAFGGWGRNEPMGAPWNPWDMKTHRVAGGSSSGSAVAVAAGLSPAAIGSDTGGSVRIPSALCGITGLKTTFGLVSLHGAVPLSTLLDTIGPLAHTAEDCALLTAAMAEGDRGVVIAQAVTARIDIAGMRIAVLSADRFPPGMEAAVLRARDEAISVLRDAGATLVEVPGPIAFDEIASRLGKLLAAEAYALRGALAERADVVMDPWVRKRVQSGKDITAAQFIAEMHAMRAAQEAFAAWMRDWDALLTPTLPIVATPVVEVDESTAPLAAFTRAVNYLGGCALSLPAGFSPSKLPVAVQLIGAPFAEGTLVRIGRAFQRATRWHRERPLLQ
jgi:aspartyl-tRNA(Asn)/glutamyl-tRNA(Gln) amidotransferase subunit A